VFHPAGDSLDFIQETVYYSTLERKLYMPDNTSDWNALLADYVDKEIILILAGAPVEPFAAMKGVVKAAEGNLWRLLCKAGRLLKAICGVCFVRPESGLMARLPPAVL